MPFYFGPFRGDLSKYKPIDKYGDFAVMTDGYVFLVYQESLRTVRWRDISERNARRYAWSEAAFDQKRRLAGDRR